MRVALQPHDEVDAVDGQRDASTTDARIASRSVSCNAYTIAARWEGQTAMRGSSSAPCEERARAGGAENAQLGELVLQ